MKELVIKLERKFSECYLQWHIVATNDDGSTYMVNSGLTERGSKSVMTQWSKCFGLTKISYDYAELDGHIKQNVETESTDETESTQPTLKSGLEFFIDVVEKSNHKSFQMGHWGKCVIGRTVGWIGNIYTTGDWETINHYFGTGFELDHSNTIVSSYRPKCVNDDQWEVIRLFTMDIGANVQKSKWLKLAKHALGKIS